MFKFLKEKLSQAASLFSKKVEEDEGVKKEEALVLEEPVEPDYEAEQGAEGFKRESARQAQLFDEEKQREAVDFARRKEESAAEEKRLNEARVREAERVKEALRQEELARQERKRREAEEEERRQEEERFAVEKREAERILEEKRREEEWKKQSFFKKLFGKKEKKPEHQPQLILEKSDFEKVKEDYSVEKEEVIVPKRDEAAEKKDEFTFERPIVAEFPKPAVAEPRAEVKAEPMPAAVKLPEIEEEKGFFGRIKESFTTIRLSEEKFDELFWDLEMGMLENNVAVEVIEKIKADLKEELTTGKVSRKSVDQIVHDTLKRSVEELFDNSSGPGLIDLVKAKGEKPFTIAFIGVNGSGKTTAMAKVAHLLLENKLSVVFAAADTFRAAAIQQLQEHADKLGVKMIRHEYDSDPAAVAFDAIKHAKAKGVDVVLIDTAGRLHTNDNLMNELKKLIRVNNPDLKIFIGEAITGNDCVEQAKLFDEAVGIDGIILAKADIDEKGGAAVSVSYVTKKPILFMGTGQAYGDLVKFDSKVVMENIGL